MNKIQGTTVIVPILITLALIYSNLYAPRYANTLFFAAIFSWVVWWFLTFQVFTGNRPGLLTSKTEKVLSQAHAEKRQADANVVQAEIAIKAGELTLAQVDFDLSQSQGNFTRAQLIKEALEENQLVIAREATKRGIPVEGLTNYLMKELEAKLQYKTAVLISGAEQQKERLKIEETIRLALTESNIVFEDRLALIDQLAEVKKRLDKATDSTLKQLLQEEFDTLKARLDAARQTDLPKADRAQA
jgi:hypothetical protein